jgi:DNA-binding HxlR family transcriptional regulator
LLRSIEKSIACEEYEGFSVWFSYRKRVGGELRIETKGKSLLLGARPLLHPSRKLLNIAAGAEDELVVCPHIPDLLAGDLRRAGIAHADLNGRLFVSGPSFLLDWRPGEIRYRNPRTGPDPFSPKASRIIRALLCDREGEWTQERLSAETGTSRTTVSQVVTQLVEDETVTRVRSSSKGTPALYQLSAFDRLLDAWVEADDWKGRGRVEQYSLLSDQPEEIAGKVLDSLGAEAVCYTQWFAGWLRHPYTTPPLVSAYVRDSKLLEIAPGRKVGSGGNLWLIDPADDGVFHGRQESGGFPLVSDVQVYLDLLQVGQRGPDQAEELRKWEGFAR